MEKVILFMTQFFMREPLLKMESQATKVVHILNGLRQKELNRKLILSKVLGPKKLLKGSEKNVDFLIG